MSVPLSPGPVNNVVRLLSPSSLPPSHFCSCFSLNASLASSPPLLSPSPSLSILLFPVSVCIVLISTTKYSPPALATHVRTRNATILLFYSSLPVNPVTQALSIQLFLFPSLFHPAFFCLFAQQWLYLITPVPVPVPIATLSQHEIKAPSVAVCQISFPAPANRFLFDAACHSAILPPPSPPRRAPPTPHSHRSPSHTPSPASSSHPAASSPRAATTLRRGTRLAAPTGVLRLWALVVFVDDAVALDLAVVLDLLLAQAGQE
ncbi:uncharacterized protein J3D65DRAFT_611685 [Phyllosticta citribraziliensis]|uniref:Uncharacterized protein n=1 Tax=Phyllosticta citribraziliensis TaxID=989973 RepID=A0ABR1MEP4_9PEZI